MSNVWPVTQGLVTQSQMDRLVARLHKQECSSFDGDRVVPAGPLTDDDRIHHEADIAAVMDVLRDEGFLI